MVMSPQKKNIFKYKENLENQKNIVKKIKIKITKKNTYFTKELMQQFLRYFKKKTSLKWDL